MHRPIETEIDGSPLIIRPLGAGREVGRSCIYLSFKGKVVLFDCGILPRRVVVALSPISAVWDVDRFPIWTLLKMSMWIWC